MNFLDRINTAYRRTSAMLRGISMTAQEKIKFTMAYVDINDYATLDAAYHAAIKADEWASKQLRIDFGTTEVIADA